MSGAGLPLILLPAALCDARLYADVSATLSDDVAPRTMVVTAPTLLDAAEQVLAGAPERFLLGGTSYGGNVALEVALAAPGRIAGLWLMGVNPGLHGNPHGAETLIARVRDGGFDAVVDDMAASCIYASGDPDGSSRECFRTMAQTIGPTRFADQMTALIARADRRADLALLTMPTLLLWGEQDEQSPPAHAELIAERAPAAEMRLIPECGHLPTLEKPVATLGPVRDWIARATAETY